MKYDIMLESLPRDLQLQVVRHFDMDTRIRCGIIGRIRVPERVKDLLHAILQPRTIRFDGYHTTMYRVDLGKITIAPNVPGNIYSLDVLIHDHGGLTWRVVNWSKQSPFCNERFEMKQPDSNVSVYEPTQT